MAVTFDKKLSCTVAIINVSDSSTITDAVQKLTDDLNQIEASGLARIVLFHVMGSPIASFDFPFIGCGIYSVKKWEHLLRRIERLQVSTVALLEQQCTQIALELSLVTDCRFATSNFNMRYARSNGAIWPGMAIYRLPRQIGIAGTRQLFLDNAPLTAERALELKIVDVVLSDLQDEDNGVERIVRFVANAPFCDFAIRRRLMQDSFILDFEEALGLHLAACERALRISGRSDPSCIGNTGQKTTCETGQTPEKQLPAFNIDSTEVYRPLPVGNSSGT